MAKLDTKQIVRDLTALRSLTAMDPARVHAEADELVLEALDTLAPTISRVYRQLMEESAWWVYE